MKRIFLLLAGCLLWLAACEGEQAGGQIVGETVSVTVTLPPTPTLVPELAANISADPQAGPVNGDELAAGATPGPLPTNTPRPRPTATPQPGARLELGLEALAVQNYSTAAEHLSLALASGSLNDEQRQEALFGLGLANLREDELAAANEALNNLLAQTAVGSPGTAGPAPLAPETAGSDLSAAYFFLAQSYQLQGDCPAAIGAYESYLAANPDMAAYVQPRIAECHLSGGDVEAAVNALAEAVQGSANRFTEVALRTQLAQYYLDAGNYSSAISQYESILDVAQTDATRGWAAYQVGSAYLLAGNESAAYSWYLVAVNDHPRAYESYLALQALVDAGEEVSDLQRGIVDYHAGAYLPGVASLERFIAAEENAADEAYFYLAWSYEALGNVEMAVVVLDDLIAMRVPEVALAEDDAPAAGAGSSAGPAWIERGKLLARAGRLEEAVDSYRSYLSQFPNGEQAPFAAWWAAALTERLGDRTAAIELYLALAESYAGHEDAAEALFRAGFLTWTSGDVAGAKEIWQSAVTLYPRQSFGAASLLWLTKLAVGGEIEDYLELAGQLQGEDYYSLRVQHFASGPPAFSAPAEIDLDWGTGAEIREAEVWLGRQLGLDENVAVGQLPLTLYGDGRLVRGQKLWQLGLYEEAKRELEGLRLTYTEDALSSYRLALFFRELGLYRSSILAARTVLDLVDVTAFEAPIFLARLVYPVYYTDLVLEQADQYGYDPLLQFALIRQESLYESFATSTAVAQGLSQVIPDTGVYIAGLLNWPDYENADLYRPYVGIAFGAFYLNQQLLAFDGFVPAALSAYNAGPGNAARWYAQAPDDLDGYLEVVDYFETRLYIERIYIGQAIYRYLYGVT